MDKENNLPRYKVGKTNTETLISVKAALKDYNEGAPKVFLRDDKLVEIGINGDDEEFIRPLDRNTMLDVLTAKSEWWWEDQSGKPHTGTPSKDVADYTLSAGKTRVGGAVPDLRGLHTGVLLDADWNIISQKGYNPKTKLYLTKTYELPPLPENPTDEDIKAMRRDLWNIFHEFKFADTSGEESVDYQNTLAALLTLIIRPTWKGALPIWTVGKSTPRIGGSLLQVVVGGLATGKMYEPRTFPTSPRELEKLYNAIMKAGVPFAIIDNVLPGANWVTPNLLTQSTGTGRVAFRILGATEEAVCNPDTFFAVNGVNLDVMADVCGRVIPTKLETDIRWQDMKCKRSETELKHLAEEMHPKIIWHVALLRRYWEQKGKPAPHACKGNISAYTDWYYEIVGMLEAAGYTHILDNLRTAQTCDNDKDMQTADFLNALWRRKKHDHFTASEVAEMLIDDAGRLIIAEDMQIRPYVPAYIAEKAKTGQIAPETVGIFLKGLVDMVVTGSMHRLRKANRTEGKRGYYLEDVAEK